MARPRKKAGATNERVPANDRRETFCREYLVDFNGTRAAVAAGYSKRSARQQASRMLTEPNIQARLDELRKERAERLEITGDQVLREFARVGFSDIRQVVTWEGDGDETRVSLTPSGDIPLDAARALSGVKVKRQRRIDEGGVTIETIDFDIRLHSKDQALQALARHLGLFEKDNNQKDRSLLEILNELRRESTNG